MNRSVLIGLGVVGLAAILYAVGRHKLDQRCENMIYTVFSTGDTSGVCGEHAAEFGVAAVIGAAFS